MDHSAPRVLKPFQNSEYRIVGRLALAAIAKASATRNAMFWFLARMPPRIATAPMTTDAMRATRTSWSCVVCAALEDLLVEVVRERRRRGDGEPGDDREDRREGDARDDAEQHRPAELVGEQRGGRVGLARSGVDGLGADERSGAVADDQGEQVEAADEPDGPLDRLAGLLARRDGVEPLEHVREARGAEHERHRQRDEVDLGREVLAVLQAGLEELVPGGRVVGRRLEERGEAEAELAEDHQRDDARCRR